MVEVDVADHGCIAHTAGCDRLFFLTPHTFCMNRDEEKKRVRREKKSEKKNTTRWRKDVTVWLSEMTQGKEWSRRLLHNSLTWNKEGGDRHRQVCFEVNHHSERYLDSLVGCPDARQHVAMVTAKVVSSCGREVVIGKKNREKERIADVHTRGVHRLSKLTQHRARNEVWTLRTCLYYL